jgi:hypothetical protein
MTTFAQNQESNKEMAAILANIVTPTNGLSLTANDNIFNKQTDGYELVIRSNDLDKATRNLDIATKNLNDSMELVRQSFARFGIMV